MRRKCLDTPMDLKDAMVSTTTTLSLPYELCRMLVSPGRSFWDEIDGTSSSSASRLL